MKNLTTLTLGGTLLSVVAAFWLAGCGDNSADPPASLAGTPTSAVPAIEAIPTLQPVAQNDIVDSTSELAQDVAALNDAQAELVALIEERADLGAVEAAQRTAAALGISIGVDADLLADAVARQDGEAAAAAATMYEDVAKAAYSGAYTLAYNPAEDISAKGIGRLWAFLNASDASQTAVFSPALGDEYTSNVYDVPLEHTAASALPQAVVSLSDDRFMLTLDGLADNVSTDGQDAAALRNIDATTPLADLKSIAAGRLALHADVNADGSYLVSIADQIVLSLGIETPDAATVFRVLADVHDDYGTQVFTFARERLVPEGLEEAVRQEITRAAIDAFVFGEGGDVDALAGLLLGDAPAPAKPVQTLSFEELIDDVLSYVPLYSVESATVTGGAVPDMRFTIAYEDVVLPSKVWCARHGGFYTADVEPGNGSVTIVIRDVFEITGTPPQFRDGVTMEWACVSPFGVFAKGQVTYGERPETATPGPLVETPTPRAAAGETQLRLYGYLFTSYSYRCQTGTSQEGFTNHMILEIDLEAGTVFGGCHIVYPGLQPDAAARVDFDVAGTVTADGVIDAEITGTLVTVDAGYEYAVDWRFTGSFTGTVDVERQKADGQYEITIEKYRGGSGANPEVVRLQWVARPTAQFE